jgi:hypothetical protein
MAVGLTVDQAMERPQAPPVPWQRCNVWVSPTASHYRDPPYGLRKVEALQCVCKDQI